MKAIERDRQVYVSEKVYSAFVNKCVVYRFAMDDADKSGPRAGSIQSESNRGGICDYDRGQAYRFRAERDYNTRDGTEICDKCFESGYRVPNEDCRSRGWL